MTAGLRRDRAARPPRSGPTPAGRGRDRAARRRRGRGVARRISGLNSGSRYRRWAARRNDRARIEIIPAPPCAASGANPTSSGLARRRFQVRRLSWRLFMSTAQGAYGGSNGGPDAWTGAWRRGCGSTRWTRVRDSRHGVGIHSVLADRPRHPRLQDLSAQDRRRRSADRRDGGLEPGALGHVRRGVELLGPGRAAFRPATPATARSISGSRRRSPAWRRSAASSRTRIANSRISSTMSARPRTARSSSAS